MPREPRIASAGSTSGPCDSIRSEASSGSLSRHILWHNAAVQDLGTGAQWTLLEERDGVRSLATNGDRGTPRWVTPAGAQLVDVPFDLNGGRSFSDSEPPRPFLYRFGEDQAEPLLKESTLGIILGALE